MSQFISGAVFASLVAALVGAMLFARRARQTRSRDEEASAVGEDLTRFAGELAHEIRNPLSTIKVNLKLTEEALADVAAAEPHHAMSESQQHRLASASRKIAIVQKETDRLEHILDGFLRYVRRPDLQYATIDLNELVSDMIDFYSPQARSHALTIRQAFSPAALMCRVDPGALKQVLLNLFINAQQAMDSGGELMIRTARRGDVAVIQINDTGRGIPPERLPTIFSPYSSSRSGGTGLGLATAKKIVEAHDGTISVHSELDKGTSFTIELPLAAVDPPASKAVGG